MSETVTKKRGGGKPKPVEMTDMQSFYVRGKHSELTVTALSRETGLTVAEVKRVIRALEREASSPPEEPPETATATSPDEEPEKPNKRKTKKNSFLSQNGAVAMTESQSLNDDESSRAEEPAVLARHAKNLHRL